MCLLTGEWRPFNRQLSGIHANGRHHNLEFINGTGSAMGFNESSIVWITLKLERCFPCSS